MSDEKKGTYSIGESGPIPYDKNPPERHFARFSDDEVRELYEGLSAAVSEGLWRDYSLQQKLTAEIKAEAKTRKIDLYALKPNEP